MWANNPNNRSAV